MTTLRYLSRIITFSLLLTSCKSDNKGAEIVYKETDLSFFNLKGKVKLFAEMKIMLEPGTGNFTQFDKNFEVNFREYSFQKSGKLTMVKNVHQSPYLPQSLIQFYRKENSLTFKLFSKKEICLTRLTKSGDKLIYTAYDKLDDNVWRNHSEKYFKKTYVKKREVYLPQSEEQGTNKKTIYNHWDYLVLNNKHVYDSLVYLKQKDKDPLLLYIVTYLQYDTHGNWLKRHFINKQQFTGLFNEYSEYRKLPIINKQKFS